MSPVEKRSRTGGRLGGLIATVVVATVLVGGASLIPGTPPASPPPTGQGSCPLPAYPDETCTGVPSNITLTTYTGPQNITTNNTVIDGKIINGNFEINATGVIIRNSVLNTTLFVADDQANYVRSQSGTQPLVTVEDSLIDCNNALGGTGIVEAHVRAVRVEIIRCDNGISVNQNMHIEDSYIHALFSAGSEAHEDGVQLSFGHWDGSGYPCCSRNVTFLHNTIFGQSGSTDSNFGTSAIISNSTGDENILIQDNLMAGGAYTLYCPRPGNQQATNYRVINNHFTTRFKASVGFFGIDSDCADETHSGNVIHETGAPVNFSEDN